MVRAISIVCCVLLAGCIDSVKPTTLSGPDEPAQVPGIPPLPPGAPTERVKATPDTVGTKGKGYGGGIISEPLRQRWRIPDRFALQQAEYALTLFNAAEGRYPASHEEFMERIVKEQMLKLPDLPPGQRYVYEPETHELMVERAGAAKKS